VEGEGVEEPALEAAEDAEDAAEDAVSFEPDVDESPWDEPSEPLSPLLEDPLVARLSVR
jgi:hypothetical protein